MNITDIIEMDFNSYYTVFNPLGIVKLVYDSEGYLVECKPSSESALNYMRMLCDLHYVSGEHGHSLKFPPRHSDNLVWFEGRSEIYIEDNTIYTEPSEEDMNMKITFSPSCFEDDDEE